MAITSALSTNELARVAALAYEGKSIRVSLALLGLNELTVESTAAAWDATKLSGNGYTDFTTTLPTGGYDATDGRLEIGGTSGANTFIDAEFSATGAGYTYDSIYVIVDDSTYIHSLLTETPAITLSDAQVITYRIQLTLDS
jgi:hypothetical protein